MKPVLFLILWVMSGLPVYGQKRDTVYTTVEQMPEFPGGMAALQKYLFTHLRSCKESDEYPIQGRMIAEFTVTKKGKIRDIRMLRAKGSCMEHNLITLIKQMPDWKPGMMSGAAVDVRYRIPLVVCFKE